MYICLSKEIIKKFSDVDSQKNFPFHPNLSNLSTQLNNLKSESINKDVLQSVSYTPPIFGVTYLGMYLEPGEEKESIGILIWINGRGLIIDPPPFTQEILDQLGIPSIYIEWFILTHCHNNHDAGAFQKILASSRVEVRNLNEI